MMIPSIDKTYSCHYCRQESKRIYVRVGQLFQTVDLCSQTCFNKYIKKAKTQVTSLNFKVRQLRSYEEKKDAAS